MRAITAIRALHWAALAPALRSLFVRWGSDLDVGKGPPGIYERQVVGTILLLGLAALAMSLTARNKQPPGKFALGLALASSLGGLALALAVRSSALNDSKAHLLEGSGWSWMIAAPLLALIAGLAATALRFRSPPTKSSKRPGRKKP